MLGQREPNCCTKNACGKKRITKLVGQGAGKLFTLDRPGKELKEKHCCGKPLPKRLEFGSTEYRF